MSIIDLLRQSDPDSPPYFVALPEFQGPMDLLINPIEQENLEITKFLWPK